MSEFSFAPRRIATIAVASFLLAASISCGDNGPEPRVLAFSYVHSGQPLDLRVPVVLNGRLEVRVSDVQTTTPEPVTLTRVESSNPSALEVVATSDDTFTVAGNAAGGVELTVEATLETSGDVRTEVLEMDVEAPTNLELWHSCRGLGEPRGLYQQGASFQIMYAFETGQQRMPSVGYYPVEATPEAIASRVETVESYRWIRFAPNEMPGTAIIASTEDFDASVDAELVPAASIDGVVRADALQVEVDQETAILQRPTVRGVPICQSRIDFTVGNLTPDICDAGRATDLDDLNDSELDPTGWVMIRPKAAGTCRFEVNYPQGNGGRGASQELNVEIIESS